MVLRLRGLINIVKGVEKCPLEPARNSKDQDALIAFKKWESRNHQALAEITLTLKREPLKYVKQYSLASEIWDILEEHYKGRSQLSQMVTYLVCD